MKLKYIFLILILLNVTMPSKIKPISQAGKDLITCGLLMGVGCYTVGYFANKMIKFADEILNYNTKQAYEYLTYYFSLRSEDCYYYDQLQKNRNNKEKIAELLRIAYTRIKNKAEAYYYTCGFVGTGSNLIALYVYLIEKDYIQS